MFWVGYFCNKEQAFIDKHRIKLLVTTDTAFTILLISATFIVGLLLAISELALCYEVILLLKKNHITCLLVFGENSPKI